MVGLSWWQKNRIGFCLSSGYFGFFAHAGFLKATEHLNIIPSYISGSSAGAIVGAMYCSGMTLEQIEKTLIDVRLIRLFTDPLSMLKKIKSCRDIKGLISNLELIISKENFYKLLKEVIPVKRFEELKIPLVVNTYDLKNRKVVYIDRGEVAEGVLLSCLHPLLFTPYLKDGRLWIDGGISDKVPILPLIKEGVDGIIISYLRSSYITIKRRLRFFKRRAENIKRSIEEAKAKRIEIKVLAPNVESAGILRYYKGKKIIKESYRYSIEKLREGGTDPYDILTE